MSLKKKIKKQHPKKKKKKEGKNIDTEAER